MYSLVCPHLSFFERANDASVASAECESSRKAALARSYARLPKLVISTNTRQNRGSVGQATCIHK